MSDSRPYVVTLGETMALMAAEQVGPLGHSSALRLGVGGSESNVAIGLQRLGVRAVWIGRVGADSLGELVTRELLAEGVDTRAIVDPTAPTGLMIKERRTPSVQRVSYYRSEGAGSRLAPEDLDLALIARASLVHVSGITPALSASAGAAVREAIALARAAGVPVSFDLNYRASLWSETEAAAAYRELLPLADLVFAGEREAELAVGPASDPMDLAQRLTSIGPTEAVVKLGADGAVAVVGSEAMRQNAVTVDVVDTVGAGDAFVAGYLAERVAGLPPQQRLLTAVRTGAFACLVPGDWEGAPRRHELGLLGVDEPVLR